MNDAASLLAHLVAIPSINPAFRTPSDPETWFGEGAMAEAVAAWLRDIGMDVALDDALPGRPNVVARLAGRNARRRLIWEGHLDTVQVAGMTDPPFEPIRRGGRLSGRGAVDDKGCLTAFMLALGELVRDPAAVDITFVAAVDEEYQSQGVLHHLARGESFDGGVAGEPTDLRIVSACKGCVRFEIEVEGRSAHSSRPEKGIDAIAIGADLVAHLRDVFGPRLLARTHPLVGPASMVCTIIDGGEGLNTIPGHCSLKFDRRTLPFETGREAWDEIDAEVRAFASRLPAEASVTVHPPFIDCSSMEVAPEARIVAAAQATCRAAGLDDRLLGVAFGSDANRMTRAGIPTIVFGPGSIEQAHTADEFVELADVERAAAMLADMARRFGET